MLAFQWWSRADYDYWKHVNYSLLFLVPLAMEGLLGLFRRILGLTERVASYPEPVTRLHAATGQGRTGHEAFPIFTIIAVILLAVSLGWAGNAWRMEKFIFWPNVEPIAAFFEGRLGTSHRVLVDDSVLRYYFSPPLRQNQITDPFYFGYHGATGEAAYAAAVRDSYFDYVVFDGGMGEEARRMQAAIRPELARQGGLAGRYELRMSMPDPVLHQKIEIYQRREPPVEAGFQPGSLGRDTEDAPLKAAATRRPVEAAFQAGIPSDILPRVEIRLPASNSVIQTDNKATRLEGVAFGASPGLYVRAEVFTNRWYPQGRNKIPVAPDGSFSETIYLAGEGTEQCYHLVRVRLYDEQDSLKATAVHYGVARANPDGSAPSCR